MQSILGPEYNAHCVNIIGHLCKGPAKDWFHHEVEHCDAGLDRWNTLEVFQGLQARFIMQRSAVDTAMVFRMLTQGDKDTLELYQELKVLGNLLPSPLDCYTFVWQYMEALHQCIS